MGLELPISPSYLHGSLCGYLCAGAEGQGEHFLRALLNNRKDELSRNAIVSLFAVFSISQQQINTLDFGFELLVPEEYEPLLIRARAFSEWCDGFTGSLKIVGIGVEQFHDEEAQGAYQHLLEFAELDCDTLDVDEEDDERALMEVSEYTRMAVLRLYNDLMTDESARSPGIHH